MKRILCLLMCCLPFVASAETGIRFDDELTWQEVREKAKEENKMIFLYVSSIGCGACRALERYTLSTEAVGKLVNEKFIPVKMMLDKFKYDTPYHKKWYADVDAIAKEYKIHAVPTMLFFAPDGKVMHRGLGYRDAGPFVSLAKDALIPERQNYPLLERYREGKVDPSALPRVANAFREHDDKGKARKIADDYKKNHLDKMRDEQLFTADHVIFSFRDFPIFVDMEGSKNKFFQYAYSNPAKVDEILNAPGAAITAVKKIIIMEEVDPKVWKLGKPVTSNPDWDGIYGSIKAKYSEEYATRITLEAQLNFYTRMENWQKFAEVRDRQIQKYPPRAGVHPGFDALGISAEQLLENAKTLLAVSDEQRVLERALAWLGLYSELEMDKQEMPLRAKVLHKLGRTAEAIDCQEKIIAAVAEKSKKENKDLGAVIAGLTVTLNKMKNGEPSWVEIQ